MNNLKAKVICAGNCPVCNKPLKEGECIFICNECKIKNEIFMELEKIKAEIIKGKCKHCDIDVNIQKCLEEHNSLCDVDDILVIIDNRLKELNNER